MNRCGGSRVTNYIVHVPGRSFTSIGSLGCGIVNISCPLEYVHVVVSESSC